MFVLICKFGVFVKHVTMADILFYYFWHGTNFGINLHSAPIQPTMNLNISTNAMNSQADLCAAELEDIIICDYERPTKG